MTRKDLLLRILHIFALSSLAFAQPLFDILSQNPTFFVASRMGASDIIWMALVLCAGIPFVLVAVSLFLRLAGKSAGDYLHASIIGFLVAVIALPFLKRLPGVPGPAVIVIAVITGIALAVSYHRFKHVFSFTSALIPAIILIPALFLFFSPVNKILFPEKRTLGSSPFISSTTPVVLVIFDELSTVSLMDTSLQIDSARFPNFGALAAESYWFRNATTNCDLTDKAVPSILTGQMPDTIPGRLPTVADFPNNLFTLLGGSYNIQEYEGVTLLCPPEYSSSNSISRRGGVFSNSFNDIKIVYLHTILPEDLSANLPPIDKSWGGFDISGIPEKPEIDSLVGHKLYLKINNPSSYPNQKRREKFRAFIDSIKESSQPSFYFLHPMLPHVPYEYSPSGKQFLLNPYNSAEYTLQKEFWHVDSWSILQSYQRYLYQLQFIDKLVGELIDKLKATGQYQESLIIITADHGVSFKANDYRRPISKDNFADILAVPLFVKLPHQEKGIVSDRNAELIDVLPTIADVLKVDVPWKMDGKSLIDSTLQDRLEKKALNLHLPDVPHLFQKYESSLIAELKSAIKEQTFHFSSGKDPAGIFRLGDSFGVVEKHIDEFEIVQKEGFYFIINNREFYEWVDIESDILLTQVGGSIKSSSKLPSTFLVVAVNGIIKGVSQLDSANNRTFTALIPENSFRNGENSFEVLLLDQNKSNVRLIRPKNDFQYVLSRRQDGQEIIRDPAGKIFSMSKSPGFAGQLDTVSVGKNRIEGWGWAADTISSTLPKQVVVFVENKFYFAGEAGTSKRQDLAKYHKKEYLAKAGYNFQLVSPAFAKKDSIRYRVFALFDEAKAVEYFLPKPIVEKFSTLLSSKYLMSQDQKTRDIKFISSDDTTVIVNDRALDGHVDQILINNGNIELHGWSADTENKKSASSVVIFSNQKYILTISTGIERPDLVEGYGSKALLTAGFRYRFPLSSLQNLFDVQHLRFFAISHDGKSASELKLPKTLPKLRIIKDSEAGLSLQLTGMQPIQVTSDALDGSVDQCKYEGDRLHLAAWAANTKKFFPASAIAMFVNDTCRYVFTPNIERPDLVQAFGNKGISRSGIDETVTGIGAIANNASVRFFAIAAGGKTATELKYYSGYPFKR